MNLEAFGSAVLLVACITSAATAQTLDKSNNSSFNAKYPAIASSNTNGLGCYMKTEDNRVINLNWMCRGELRHSVVTAVPSLSSGSDYSRSSNYSGGSGDGSGNCTDYNDRAKDNSREKSSKSASRGAVENFITIAYPRN